MKYKYYYITKYLSTICLNNVPIVNKLFFILYPSTFGTYKEYWYVVPYHQEEQEIKQIKLFQNIITFYFLVCIEKQIQKNTYLK